MWGEKKKTCNASDLAVDLAAAQCGLNDVEQSVREPLALSHPASCFLSRRAHVPAEHTQQMEELFTLGRVFMLSSDSEQVFQVLQDSDM